MRRVIGIDVTSDFYEEVNSDFGTSFSCNFEIDWVGISSMVDLSNEIIDKYVNWLAFNILSLYHNLSYDFVDRYCHKLNWVIISNRSGLTEEFIERYCDRLNWSSICDKQVLSESFIEKHIEMIDWKRLFSSQILSEEFIERYCDRIGVCGVYNVKKYAYDMICRRQVLSESFIEKHIDVMNMDTVIRYQNLSEEFIEKHFYEFPRCYIIWFQDLSEEFIEKHIYDFELDEVLKSKCLSEDFIERHIGDEDFSWIDVAKHQKLSDNFIKKHSDELSNVLYYLHDNWNYKSVSDKKQAIVDTGLYECYDDYFIAYKAIRINRYSLFTLKYKYETGCVYDSLCDCSDNENSYGLNVGSEYFAINYGDSSSFCYNVVRCKVRYEDVGRVVHGGQKIRCFMIEVLD